MEVVASKVQVIKDAICTLYFYLNRCSNEKAEKIYVYIDNILTDIDKQLKDGICGWHTYLYTLYKMLFQTRDCINGKGERIASYVFLCAFYKHYPQQSMYALHNFALYFGSWGDIKYFCGFVKEFKLLDAQTKNNLITTAVDILIYQFDMDCSIWNIAFSDYLQKLEREPFAKHDRPYAPDMISFTAKWIPRESSAYGWLNDIIVRRYYTIHMPFLFDESSTMPNMNKLKMDFRKKIAALNRELKTCQTYMTNKKTDLIEPSRVTLQTIIRQNDVFFNYDRKGCNYDQDIICDRFHQYVDSENIGRHCKKNMNISLDLLVKKGFKLIGQRYDCSCAYQIKLLDQLWTKLCASFCYSLSTIPVIDLSGGQKYNAIGMGILIAQLSTYKKLIVCENQFDVLTIDVSETFTDILRRLNDYKCVFFHIRGLFSFLYEKHNSGYIDPMQYVILSSEKNILVCQEEIRDYYDKNVNIVFWNVLTCDETVKDLVLSRFFYVSGSSPKLIDFLRHCDKNGSGSNKSNKFFDILCESLQKYDFVNQIMF
jgi:hypothetical protein